MISLFITYNNLKILFIVKYFLDFVQSRILHTKTNFQIKENRYDGNSKIRFSFKQNKCTSSYGFASHYLLDYSCLFFESL